MHQAGRQAADTRAESAFKMARVSILLLLLLHFSLFISPPAQQRGGRRHHPRLEEEIFKCIHELGGEYLTLGLLYVCSSRVCV